MSTEYSLSLWSADLTNLGNAVKETEQYADYYHFDVADGHFGKTFLFFPDLIKSLRPLTGVPFDVHLIVKDPERYIETFSEAGSDIITVYPESCENLARTLVKIRKHNIKASLALSPEISISIIESVIDLLDMIVVMGTDIDVKSSSLLPSTYQRIRDVSKIFQRLKIDKIKIEADGGIRKETVPKLIKAGADILVPGSLVFKSRNYAEIFSWLRSF
jgi:ribulose-phosphate 3-epimerase